MTWLLFETELPLKSFAVIVIGMVVSTFFAGTVIWPELKTQVWSAPGETSALGLVTLMVWLSNANVTSAAPVSLSLITATIEYFCPIVYRVSVAGVTER